jgi:hypothetical protein
VLNWLGIFTSIFGLDTAILVTLLAGYKTFHNSISALLEKRISADIALCVAVIAVNCGQGKGRRSRGSGSPRRAAAEAQPAARKSHPHVFRVGL